MIPEPDQMNNTDDVTLMLENKLRFRSMDQSPDGKYLACGCFDGQIKIYELDTLKQFGSDLLGHSEPCDLVRYSPDGQLIASVGFLKNQIRIWNVKSQQQVGCLEGHTGDVNTLGYSPQGEYIVSGSQDHSVRIWSCKTYKQDGDTLIGDSIIRSIQYSPNGQHIISGTENGNVMIWDSITRHQVRILKGHSDRVRLVQCSSDSTQIVSVCKYRILIHDATTGLELTKFPLDNERQVNSVAISPDFELVLVDRYQSEWRDIWDDVIELYSIVSGKKVLVKFIDNDDVDQVQFSRDGKFIRIIINGDIQMLRLATIIQKL